MTFSVKDKQGWQEVIVARKQAIEQAEQTRQNIVTMRDAVMRGRVGKEDIFLALNEFATYLLLYGSLQQGLVTMMETFHGAKPPAKNNIFPLRKMKSAKAGMQSGKKREDAHE